MNYRELIGKRVINQATKKKGKIIDIVNNKILVFDGFDTVKYSFPDAFSDILLLEDTALQEELQEISNDASFSQFKSLYSKAIQKEIDYLKIHGDRRYRIVDGVRISKDRTTYIYSFDTDSEFRFPDGTGIKLWFPDKIVSAYVISCEEFSIVFQTTVDLGDEINSLEFTSEPWGLIEPLLDRLEELNPVNARLSYELVNKRRSMIDRQGTEIGRAHV